MTSHRFCIVNNNSVGIIGKISLVFLSHRLNVEQQFTRTYGHRCFCVFDIDIKLNEEKRELLLKTLKLEIVKIPGVLSCDLNHFTHGVQKENSERLCIVNRNTAGVLQGVCDVITKSGLEIISQVVKTSGNYGFTIIEVAEFTPTEGFTLGSMVQKIVNATGVISCDIGNFVPGSLSKLELLEKNVKQDPESNEDYERDSGYLTGSGSSLGEGSESDSSDDVSITSALVRSNTTKLANLLQKSLSMNIASPDKIGSKRHKVKRTLSFEARELAALEAIQDHSAEQTTNYYEGSSKLQGAPKTRAMAERKTFTSISNPKLVIAMVGLPCRGKSFSARKLEQFFNWRCTPAKIFNAGAYRREKASNEETNRADFFDASNAEGERIRTDAAIRCLKDLLVFLVEGGEVGIFDATNTTKLRRATICEVCKNIANVVFIEVICDDLDMLRENYQIKVQNSPDFVGLEMEEAIEDLENRVANYEKVYETVDEAEQGGKVAFVKFFNMSSKIICKGVYGRITRSVVPYLSSLHLGSRRIILVRAGLGKVVSKTGVKPGGKTTDDGYTPSGAAADSSLSSSGKLFAKRLGLFLKTIIFMNKQSRPDIMGAAFEEALPMEMSFDDPTTHVRSRTESKEAIRISAEHTNLVAEFTIFCSTLKRAVSTAKITTETALLENTVKSLPMLNPINRGKFGNLSPAQIQATYPEFWQEYKKNPFYTRFPGGESYEDIVAKLEPIIIDIEQQTSPVLVVGHISALQILMAYFRKIPVDQSLDISTPMHTAVELQPLAGEQWREKRYTFTV